MIYAILELKNPWTHVILSNARRATYFRKGNKLPKKYQTKDYIFNTEGFLVHKVTKVKPVKNSKSAGTPRCWKINGQDLINGNIHARMRAKIFKEVKTYLINEFNKTPFTTHHFSYPLSLSFLFYDEIGLGNWDLDNRAIIWVKWIQDALVDCGILNEDNIKHIQEIKIRFIESSIEDRKIEIIIGN